MGRRVVPVIAAAVAIIVIFALVAAARHRRLDGTLLIEAQCNGEFRLFAIDSDGSNLRPVNWDGHWDLSFSPDGRYIAYVTDDGIYTAQYDGVGKRRVAGRSAEWPEFSPDGERIVYCTPDGFFVVNRDGSGGRRIARRDAPTPVFTSDSRRIAVLDGGRCVIENPDGTDRYSFPADRWTSLELSPDCRRMACVVGGEYPDCGVCISDMRGRALRFLAKGDSPVFSPDGRTVAFRSVRNGKQGPICLVDLDGRHERVLAGQEAGASFPIFSPDGARIVSLGKMGESEESLYITDADGRNARRFPGASPSSSVVFSPDGKRLVYSTGDGLYMLPVDGGKPRRITRTGAVGLCWAKPPHIQGKPRPSVTGLPRGYFVDTLVTADFDGDGAMEQACTAASVLGDAYLIGANENAPLMVLVARGDKVILKSTYGAASRVSHLKAVDLTGDGRPELTYDVETYGASDIESRFHAYRFSDGSFRNAVGTRNDVLAHLCEGGLVAVSGGSGKPSTLVLYNFIWGDDESHYAPHRYRAEWYDLRNGEFTLTARKETARKCDAPNPLAEFGVRESSSRVMRL